MAEQKTVDLAAENAALKAELEKLRGAKMPPPRPVDSGDFVSTKPHYRRGRMYQPGEIISIVSEIPGKDWTKVVKGAPEQPAARPPAPSVRPSDRSI